MYIVDGVNKGRSGDLVRSVTGNVVIRVPGKKYVINKDLKTFKELGRSEGRTVPQMLLCILLALTLIGIPLAILIFLVWKKVSWTAGCETHSGERFVISSNSKREYNRAKKYFGLGAINDF